MKKYPELYNEILKRGHRVGNHTFNHVKGFSTGVEEYVANVDMAAELIESDLFRPPHGRIRPRQRKSLRDKYDIIMWDLLTRDYDKRLMPDIIMNNIRRLTRKGSIVVFHDSIKARNNMLATLPRAIEYWNEQGYRDGLL